MTARETSLRDRLPWMAVLVALVTAAALLLGPLWDDARGENPLLRPPGPDWEAILRLGLPTVIVAACLALALMLPRRPLVGVGALVVLGYAVVQAPGVMTLWFVPTLLLAGAGWLVALLDRGRGRREPARV